MTSLLHDLGTVTVESGSPLITGEDTAWSTLIGALGGLLTIEAPGNPLIIKEVNGDGEIIAATNWTGLSGTYRYAIARASSDGLANARLWTMEQMGELMRKPWGIPASPNGRGTIAQRDAIDPMPDDYYLWLRVEVDEPLELYFRVAGQWLGPYPFQGDQGVPGPSMTPAGEWDSATTYKIGDYVSHDDRTFASRVDNNLNNEPPVAAEDSAEWMWLPIVGAGDVSGPSSVTDGHVALFDGATGKRIKSAGRAIGSVGSVNLPSQPEGRVLDDSGDWVEAGGSVDALFDEDLGKSPAEQAQARENIGAVNMLPIGAVLFDPRGVGWPGFLELNGSSFDVNVYADLAELYPAGVLPDFTDRVPRGAGPLAGAAGATQEDAMQRITGSLTKGSANGGVVAGQTGSDIATDGALSHTSGITGIANTGAGFRYVELAFDSGNSPGARVSDDETRVKAVIGKWYIKAYGAYTNVGNIDVELALGAKVSKLGDTDLGGFTSDSEDLGSLSGAVDLMVDAGKANFKHGSVTAAFQINAPTSAGCYTVIVELVNSATAGAMTLSGFDDVDGVSYTTTSGDKYLLFIVKSATLTTATLKGPFS